MSKIVYEKTFKVQIQEFFDEIKKKFDTLEIESHKWLRHKFDEITEIF